MRPVDSAGRCGSEHGQGIQHATGWSPKTAPQGFQEGLFAPIRRCRTYNGDLWARIATVNSAARGMVEVGLRRHVTTPDGVNKAGEHLVSQRLPITGLDWVKLDYQFELREGRVAFGEPIDFYVRWLPADGQALLIDRAVLNPADAINGLDPEIIELSKAWPVPLLRWPGWQLRQLLSLAGWRRPGRTAPDLSQSGVGGWNTGCSAQMSS